MSSCDVLVVGGTHGNEVNAPWLLDQWDRHPDLLDVAGLSVQRVIGNPAARAAGRRYVDRDLNRSFRRDLLDGAGEDLELVRARELLAQYGPAGSAPSRVVLDLHSTTAAMGNCLVVYGRRPADLALAALVQSALGLPVYLHEADAAQTGFLVEQWPCGLVVEVGPVPQGVLDARVVTQTRLALEACFRSLHRVRKGLDRDPELLVVHRHLCSRDLPRDAQGQPTALLHPARQGRDWHPLDGAAPLFVGADATSVETLQRDDVVVPVFVNEAAYAEKHIALSLTQREVWSVKPQWTMALHELLQS